MQNKKQDKHIKNRHFGTYGGRYVPEMLIPALEELESAYEKYRNDKQFLGELSHLFKTYSGRPTPLYYAANLTKHLGKAKIYLKLEGANHTGSHKINNALGQILLAKRLGKKNIIAETGAGQHGVASATVAAAFGLSCKVFMGSVDIKRQYPNVYAMQLLGAEVESVEDGTRTLKDAVNAALKHWIENLESSHYLLGSALGPYPYPLIVRDFQSIIGREVREQIQTLEGRQPHALIACVGGGSNSMGLFYPYINESVKLIGVEAGGRGTKSGEHASRFQCSPQVGIVQGYKSYFLQNSEGQLMSTHSISAGLDYAGVGPELAYFHDQGRIQFTQVSDDEALAAFKFLAQKEGILPALESSHAVAYGLKYAKSLSAKEIIVINISGRGDKDLFITANALDRNNWREFLKNELA